jgi:hypothetical protein
VSLNPTNLTFQTAFVVVAYCKDALRLILTPEHGQLPSKARPVLPENSVIQFAFNLLPGFFNKTWVFLSPVLIPRKIYHLLSNVFLLQKIKFVAQ